MGLSFEWDERKAESNLRMHGVSFREATTVFADPLAITISDPSIPRQKCAFSTSAFPASGVCSWYRTRSEPTKSAL
jgi:Ribonuclease toxin, BrnT, of type II toxin-antitoxin system